MKIKNSFLKILCNHHFVIARPWRASAVLLLLVTGYWLLITAVNAEPPNLLTYQGRLKESGQPVTGSRSVDIWLWKQLSGGTEGVDGFSTVNQSVSVSNGLFRSTFTVPSSVNLETGDWYLELRVDGAIYSPREKLTSSAYAVYSASASYANNLVSAPGASGIFASSSIFVTQGNVGIGTTVPGTILHLSQNYPRFRLQDTQGSGINYDIENGQYGAGIFTIRKANDISIPPPFSINSGNVGIGTTGPCAKWEVQQTDTAQAYSVKVGTSSTAYHLVVSTSGNIGIGTTNPTVALEVNGSIKSSGVGGNVPHACYTTGASFSTASSGINCLAGEIVVGGGGKCPTSGAGIISSFPSGASWQVQCGQADPSNEVYAICCKN